MSTENKPTYYEFFGLNNFENDAGKIKRAYRTMALKYHPDRNTDKVKAEQMMVQVNEIYRILSVDKVAYDRHLLRKLKVKNNDRSEHWSDAFRYATGAPKGPYSAWEFSIDEAEEVSQKAWDDLDIKLKKERKQQEESLAQQWERREWLNTLTNDEFFAVKEFIKQRRSK